MIPAEVPVSVLFYIARNGSFAGFVLKVALRRKKQAVMREASGSKSPEDIWKAGGDSTSSPGFGPKLCYLS